MPSQIFSLAAVVGILSCSFHLFDLFHLHFNFLLCLWLFWLLFLLALLLLDHLNFCVCCYFWLALVVDGSDVYHFAADWPRTHQSHSIFRVPLLQVLDLVGHLGVQFTETHYYPVFAPQGLVLKGQVRLHHISQPSQGRHLDDLVRLSQTDLFGRCCPLGLFGSSWLSKLKQSPDNSNVTFFELMLQVVGELDSRIHVTPAQPRLLPSQIDIAQTRRPRPLHLPLPSTKFLERGRPLLPRGLFVAVDVDEGEERDGEASDDEEESDECVENFVERAHIFQTQQTLYSVQQAQSSEGLLGRGGRRGRVGRARPRLLYRALQRVDRVALIARHHVRLVNALQNVRAALLQALRVDSRLLRQLLHHAAHVPLLDCLAVGLEGVQKLHLVVILVEPVEERSDLGLVSVDAVLDQFFLVQSPEAGECDLVEEAAPFLFAFPRLHFCHQLVAVEAGQLLLLGVAQLHHPPHQLVLLDPQIAVQLQQRVVPCPYELLQGDARLSRVDRSFKQEQNYQLRLDVKRELLDLRVVDLVEAQQAVVVVDGVESVHEFIDESVAEVELEGGEHVEVGPGVEVKADLELLFVDDALLVEVVEQSVEYLQLLQLETQILAHHRPLPNALVAALNLTQVLPESRNTYFTVLAATFYDFLPLRLTKLSTMKASLLMIRSQIPALYASSYSAPNYTSLKMLFSVFQSGLEWKSRATSTCYKCLFGFSRKGLGCYRGEAASVSLAQSSNLIVKPGLFLSCCLAMLEY